MPPLLCWFIFCLFHVPAPPEIYTLSLHDALPISFKSALGGYGFVSGENYAEFKAGDKIAEYGLAALVLGGAARSEEHTSELQSLTNLVCRLLLEKKKKNTVPTIQLSDISYSIYRY